MAERKPNNYASEMLFILYVAGTISAQPWSDYTWAQSWRSMIWPVYITWVEVGDYIERRAALSEDSR